MATRQSNALMTRLMQLRDDNMKITQLLPENEAITEAMQSGLAPPVAPPPVTQEDTISGVEEQKALACAQMQCDPQENKGAVCACNFNTGNVVTFKNECDLRRHNCRFNTAFKVILNEICPWEFESRRDSSDIDYNRPSFYNY